MVKTGRLSVASLVDTQAGTIRNDGWSQDRSCLPLSSWNRLPGVAGEDDLGRPLRERGSH